MGRFISWLKQRYPNLVNKYEYSPLPPVEVVREWALEEAREEAEGILRDLVEEHGEEKIRELVARGEVGEVVAQAYDMIYDSIDALVMWNDDNLLVTWAFDNLAGEIEAIEAEDPNDYFLGYAARVWEILIAEALERLLRSRYER